ncbi:MAG: hypothetical protein KDA45_09495, partial [Planctomycetales bacterium]|nr:hypothetical protein [Planctomycetales bacterium]
MNGSLLLLRSPIVWLALGCSLSTPWGASLASAVTEQQRAQVAELVAGVQAAGQLYSAGEFLDAASRIAQLQESLVALLQSPDPSLHRMVRPIYARLARAHALLELEGAELAALPTWEELTSAQETP